MWARVAGPALRCVPSEEGRHHGAAPRRRVPASLRGENEHRATISGRGREGRHPGLGRSRAGVRYVDNRIRGPSHPRSRDSHYLPVRQRCRFSAAWAHSCAITDTTLCRAPTLILHAVGENDRIAVCDLGRWQWLLIVSVWFFQF